jgi:hypothetical protein
MIHLKLIIIQTVLLLTPMSITAATDPLESFISERDPIDYRDITTGSIIPDEDWGEQPLIVKMEDGRWFCVLTTGRGKEGSSSQHIVYTISSDKGKTWTDLRDIEPADGPEASSACPFIVPCGPAKERIYVFYVFNANNVREIRKIDGSPMSRVDLLGEHAFRFTDDYGETWSERHFLPYRKTSVDLNNPSRGKIQLFWPNDKPMLDKGQLFLAFSKIGGHGSRYFWTSTEGWMWRCDNILEETDVSELTWTMLPDGDQGLKAPEGVINEEPMSTVLSDGSLYCVTRTVQGHPAEFYSRDRGHTWTNPAYMKYASDGRHIAHPRANSPVWKLSNGKYLYWFHNQTGNPVKTFSDRNPAWVSGGIEVDGPNGKILKWSEPEILLYTDPDLRHVGLTYPDLVEDDGDVYVSETQESIARVHKVDRRLLEGLWGQFDTLQVFTEKGLVASLSGEELLVPSIKRLPTIDNFTNKGATIDFEFKVPELRDRELLTTLKDGHGWTSSVNSHGGLTFSMFDGNQTFHWRSDDGIIKAGRLHHVALVMDSRPGIFFAVVDGIFMDSTHDHERQFGWGRYSGIDSINGSGILKGELEHVRAFRLYNRPIRTTEAIANYLSK